ncbi:hypothetical protein NL676_010817 [Syzygium grande]|nr:hypothetical protein NL676_010817 [Syzygium grande]
MAPSSWTEPSPLPPPACPTSSFPRLVPTAAHRPSWPPSTGSSRHQAPVAPLSSSDPIVSSSSSLLLWAFRPATTTSSFRLVVHKWRIVQPPSNTAILYSFRRDPSSPHSVPHSTSLCHTWRYAISAARCPHKLATTIRPPPLLAACATTVQPSLANTTVFIPPLLVFAPPCFLPCAHAPSFFAVQPSGRCPPFGCDAQLA